MAAGRASGFHQARFHVKDHVSQNGEMLPIFMNDKSSKSETYLENKVYVSCVCLLLYSSGLNSAV